MQAGRQAGVQVCWSMRTPYAAYCNVKFCNVLAAKLQCDWRYGARRRVHRKNFFARERVVARCMYYSSLDSAGQPFTDILLFWCRSHVHWRALIAGASVR